MKRLLFIILAIAALLPSGARKRSTASGRLKVDIQAVATQSIAANRHIAPDEGQISLAGYDKPVNSRHETLLVTNHGYDDVDSILLSITYTDLKQRQLHRRSLWVGGPFPGGETRQASFSSWDKQFSYRYRRSAPSRKQHTPYDVKISIDSISIK